MRINATFTMQYLTEGNTDKVAAVLETIFKGMAEQNLSFSDVKEVRVERFTKKDEDFLTIFIDTEGVTTPLAQI